MPGSVVLLDRRIHNRRDFDCGCEPLDRYLRERAAGETRKRVAVCYVLVQKDNPSAIVGYYTLSNLSVELAELPSRLGARLPRYPNIPATLIGRLAVDSRYRGQRLGELLLMDALARALATSDVIGSALVVVDPKHEAAAAFYGQYDFMPLRHRDRRLFLPMRTIAGLFQARF